jgi:BirA family biotin operon repressor/biotin-[acetyl-CoA-carboxylase] ligase
MMERLRPQVIKEGLNTQVIGSSIICLDVTDSTNEYAWIEALKGAPDGTVIFAEEQTKGRGRFERKWFSPRSKSILCSVIIRPNIKSEDINLIVAIGALSVVDAIKEVAGLDAMIQFPNDVVISGKKVCGILVESRFISTKPDVFILGIGINVNIKEEDFPADIKESASSLLIEKGSHLNRIILACSLLNSLDRWYEMLFTNPVKIKEKWKELSFILNKRVSISEAGKIIKGTVFDIDIKEGIIVRLDSGLLRSIQSEYVEEIKVTN